MIRWILRIIYIWVIVSSLYAINKDRDVWINAYKHAPIKGTVIIILIFMVCRLFFKWIF